jgi:hypothetical protein
MNEGSTCEEVMVKALGVLGVTGSSLIRRSLGSERTCHDVT